MNFIRFSLLLLVGAIALAGCGPKGVVAGQAFADRALQDISRDWDEKMLEQYAGKEFYDQCPKPQAAQILKALKERLGVLKTFKQSKLDGPTPSPSPGDKKELILRFIAEADFAKGPGSVLLVVQEKDGRWTLNGFEVRAAALSGAPPAPAASPTP